MANELKVSFAAGKTLYAIVFNSVGQVWNTGTVAFESYVTANITSYPVALTNLGVASSFYEGNFPVAITAGIYDIVAKQQLGGSAAESDPTIATEDGFSWNGVNRVSLSDLATC